MAKKYLVCEKPARVLTAIECDRCKRTVTLEDDMFEAQEFLCIEQHYGYGSKYFGDMTKMEVDLCEKCTQELLAPFCRVEDESVVFIPMEDVDNTE